MEQLKNNVFDTALIFEGGGMRGSYTAAVANILLENEIYFDNVYGLSAGSSNTVNYISRDIDRTKRSFVDLVDDPEFGGVDTLIKGKGFFYAEHIYQKAGLPGGYLPFDWDTFVANPAKATIESFDRDSGETVYWTKDDMPTLEDMMIRVRASSSLPMFMPPPCINGRYYYDGGLGEGGGFLLPRAQRDGFKKFLIIRTRPRAYRKSKPEGAGDALMNTALWRRHHVVRALNDRWARYNLIADEIDRLGDEGAAYVFYAEGMKVTSSETSKAKLQESYDTGYAQAEEELPAIKRFLGLQMSQ